MSISTIATAKPPGFSGGGESTYRANDSKKLAIFDIGIFYSLALSAQLPLLEIVPHYLVCGYSGTKGRTDHFGINLLRQLREKLGVKHAVLLKAAVLVVQIVR